MVVPVGNSANHATTKTQPIHTKSNNMCGRSLGVAAPAMAFLVLGVSAIAIGWSILVEGEPTPREYMFVAFGICLTLFLTAVIAHVRYTRFAHQVGEAGDRNNAHMHDSGEPIEKPKDPCFHCSEQFRGGDMCVELKCCDTYVHLDCFNKFRNERDGFKEAWESSTELLHTMQLKIDNLTPDMGESVERFKRDICPKCLSPVDVTSMGRINSSANEETESLV